MWRFPNRNRQVTNSEHLCWRPRQDLCESVVNHCQRCGFFFHGAVSSSSSDVSCFFALPLWIKVCFFCFAHVGVRMSLEHALAVKAAKGLGLLDKWKVAHVGAHRLGGSGSFSFATCGVSTVLMHTTPPTSNPMTPTAHD